MSGNSLGFCSLSACEPACHPTSSKQNSSQSWGAAEVSLQAGFNFHPGSYKSYALFASTCTEITICSQSYHCLAPRTTGGLRFPGEVEATNAPWLSANTTVNGFKLCVHSEVQYILVDPTKSLPNRTLGRQLFRPREGP